MWMLSFLLISFPTSTLFFLCFPPSSFPLILQATHSPTHCIYFCSIILCGALAQLMTHSSLTHPFPSSPLPSSPSSPSPPPPSPPPLLPSSPLPSSAPPHFQTEVPQIVSKKGYVFKTGSDRTGWKRRWCTVNQFRGIEYFKSETVRASESLSLLFQVHYNNYIV